MKTMYGVRTLLLFLALMPLASPATAQVQGEAPLAGEEMRPPPAGTSVTRNIPTTAGGGPASRAAAAGTAPGSSQDIRDIRGPIDIPDPWLWAQYAAVGLGGLLLLYVAWRFWRRRKQPVKAPHERAFEALERARELMQPEHAREFSFRVSGVVRVYIEERFAVASTHQTTAEFLRCVAEQESGPLAAQRVLLAEFLKNCDLVKFARFGLTREEMEAMVRSAWQFVDSTKPAAEESRPRRAAARRKRPAGTTAAAQKDPAVGQNHFAVGGVS
jgi:hypothetical protein